MPTPTTPATRESNPSVRRPVGIVQALTSDHNKVRALIARVVQDVHLAPQLYPQIAESIRRHDVAEDTTLYTLLARKHPLLVEQSRGQHARVAAALRRLDNTVMDHPIWQSRFGEMNRALETHLRFEEGRTFDAARMLPERVQQRLATEYKALMRERQSNPPVFRKKKIKYGCFTDADGVVHCPPTMSTVIPGLAASTQAEGLTRIQQLARQVEGPSWWERLFGRRARNLMLNPGMQTLLKYPNAAQTEDRFWHPWRYPPTTSAGDSRIDLGKGIRGESSSRAFLGSPARGVRRLAPRAAPLPNPDGPALVADAANAHRLAQNYPQFVSIKRIPDGLGGWHGKSWVYLRGGAQAIAAGRLGSPSSCPPGMTVMETIQAALSTPTTPGNGTQLRAFKICRPLGVTLALPGQASDVHTDVYGNQYTVSNKSRKL